MLGISSGSIGLALVFLLVVIFTLSEGARYRLKFTLFIIICAIATIWPFPFMIVKFGDWRNALIPAWQLRKSLNLLGVKFIVRGHENIVKNSGAVILINHQSCLDLGVLAEIWKIIDNCVVVAKRELLLYSGVFGLAAWAWGTLYIDKSKGSDARKAMNTTVDAIQKRKSKLIVFPEGTRHAGSILRPFKKGAFHVALAAKAPIQPIIVSKYYFLNDRMKKFDSGIAYITILPPIPTEGVSPEELDRIVADSYEIMNREFQRTSEEVIKDVGAKKIN